MSNAVIDQPQSKYNLSVITDISPWKNLKFKFSSLSGAEGREPVVKQSTPETNTTAAQRINSLLADILTSPSRTKLLLMFLENLQSSEEPVRKTVAESSLSEANQGVSDIACTTPADRTYRGALPQMACMAVQMRKPATSAEAEPLPVRHQKARPVKNNQPDRENQIVILGNDDCPRPTLKKFNVDEIKPHKSKPWSRDVDIALRELVGRKISRQAGDVEQNAAGWINDYQAYNRRSQASDQYVYIWADVHTYRTKNNSFKKEFLSLYGVNAKGRITLLAVDEGEARSADLWRAMLVRLEQNNLANPRLFIGGSNLPIWDILPEIFPRAQFQFCWEALKAGIIAEIETEHRDEIEYFIRMMRDSSSELEASDWADQLKQKYGSTYPHAVVEILKSRDHLFTYFRYPQIHWNILKSTKNIAAGYPSDDLLATICKYEPFRKYSLYLVFYYLLKHSRNNVRINGRKYLKKVMRGKFAGAKKNLKPEIEFIERKVTPPKNTVKSVVAQKINNTDSAAFLQSARQSGVATQSELSNKTDKLSKPEKQFSKIVLKRKPETAPASESRTEELKRLLHNHWPKDSAPSRQHLLDNLAKLPELEKSREDRPPAIQVQNPAISAMEMEILAGRK